MTTRIRGVVKHAAEFECGLLSHDEAVALLIQTMERDDDEVDEVDEEGEEGRAQAEHEGVIHRDRRLVKLRALRWCAAWQGGRRG